MKSRAEEVAVRMVRLGIAEAEIEEEFIRGGGPGGQKINKTASTVRLKHRPSGLEVRCQAERSLSLNRLTARERLCQAIEDRINRAAREARQKIEKERRQKRPRPTRLKRQLVESKRRRGALKAKRQRPHDD